MNVFFTILTVLVLIASILITLVVLLQNGKGGGLASNFVAGNQAFGVRQTADILEKITWGLAIFVLVVSIVSSFSLNREVKDLEVTERIEAETSAPEFPATLPTENPAN